MTLQTKSDTEIRIFEANHKIPLFTGSLGDGPGNLYMYLFIDRNLTILNMLRLLIILSLLRRGL